MENSIIAVKWHIHAIKSNKKSPVGWGVIGRNWTRTSDHLLVRQALYQLSYPPAMLV
jgi:hypothetical protein